MTTAPQIAAIEGLEEPLVEGVARRIAVRLTNPGPDPIALLDLRADGPRDGAHSWRKPPFGSILYDAIRDAYVHFTDAAAIGAVPLETGIVPATSTAEALLPIKSLAPGKRTIRISARWRTVPAAELAARLYLPPETMEGRKTRYELGRERKVEPGAPPGRSILRASDLPIEETSFPIDVTTIEDASSPGRAAAERGKIVDRMRAIGWIVERAAGDLVAISAERTLELGGAVDARALAWVDDLPPGESVTLMLRGERARALEETLPVEGLGHGQRWFERESLGDVLAALVAARAKIGLGSHGVAAFGWIVE